MAIVPGVEEQAAGKPPTGLAELNAVLAEFMARAQVALGGNFLGACLTGSFALGDADEYSDVDFLVAVERDIPDAELPALQAMHAAIHALPPVWSRRLDGSYIPRAILRRPEPQPAQLLYLDNGSRELVRSVHSDTLVERWMARECGVPLAGQNLRALVDPVPADALRREVAATMRDWGKEIDASPAKYDTRFYQPFVVLSYCRMLHTLAIGRVGSKPAAAAWALANLDPKWAGLIRRAQAQRGAPEITSREPADPADFARTLDFIRSATGMVDLTLKS
jgi:predicted nucleotidyltransferase